MFGTMSYPSWMIGLIVLSTSTFLQLVQAQPGSCDGDSDYLCSNNECIRDAYRCDRENDCSDNSDEFSCPNATCGGILTATSGVIQTPNYPLYYPSNAKCTWIIQGPEGSHVRLRFTKFALEASEYRPEHGDDLCYDWLQFHDTSFMCSNGDCISPIAECNGVNDCVDNSDEHEYCLPKDCSITEFTCDVPDTRRCIQQNEQCDGFEDCADGADESNCYTECNFAEFTCDVPDTRRCIRHNEQCDGFDDCADGADELNCHPDCDDDEDYLCDNGRCIYSGFICDTENDCHDNSDEGLCPAVNCGGQLNETSGEIKSPNYPSSYPNNARCTWTIQGPPDSKITLRFLDFNLETPTREGSIYYDIINCTDWLEIFASKSGDDDGSVYCGHVRSYETYTSKGNYLWIQFRSGSDVVDSGFRIEYSIRSSDGSPGPSDGSSGSLGYIGSVAGGIVFLVIIAVLIKLCKHRPANNSTNATASSRSNAAYQSEVGIVIIS